jgi:hypothetical protein
MSRAGAFRQYREGALETLKESDSTMLPMRFRLTGGVVPALIYKGRGGGSN